MSRGNWGLQVPQLHRLGPNNPPGITWTIKFFKSMTHSFNSQPKISSYQTFYQEEMNTPPCPYLKALHTLPDGLKIRNQDRFFFDIKAPRILQTWMVFLDPGRAWDVQALTVAVKLRPNLLLHSQALTSTHKHSKVLISTHKKLLILLERSEALMFLRRNSGQKWNRPSSKDFPQGSISWAHWRRGTLEKKIRV